MSEIILKIDERIEYAQERIDFWAGYSTQQVWIGIKAELERLKSSVNQRQKEAKE